MESIDLLFLEVDADTFGFQNTHIFQALDRISSESGHGFRDDVVHLDRRFDTIT